MAGFRIDNFRGLRPRISAKKLEVGEAATAQNLKLGSGDLEPIPEKTTVQATSAERTPRTIYLYDNAGAPVWFEWDDYVDVARGPVKDDSLERTYYTGDTLGNGAPKLTTTALANKGGGGPYPEDWWYIGVPAPVNAPTVAPTSLPEDVPSASRIATNLKTDELVIDEVQWTVYPGTGTRNQTWRLDAAAAGSIAFDVQPGTSFRVVNIINKNRVTLESATEPGIAMRTLNADKTTVNDWHPMDEQGSTQEADFLGWRVPVGMEVTIPSHNLNVGDAIAVSAVNIPPQFFAALTTDFYEQDWNAEVQISEAGTSFQQVTDARLSASAVSGNTPWQLSGSFYYDVDRAASTVSELEDRSYVYTYVNSLGEEGPPSPASTATPLLDGQSVLLSNLSLPPTIGYDITKMRLYRTNSTEAGTEFQFVKEFDISRSTRDEVRSANLGEVISTTTWDPPDPAMLGIIALPNGILAGFNGKQLYFCEPYFPHAWPPEYDQAVEYDIVGLAAFGNSLAVLTKGWPYIVTGSHPRNMNVRAIKVNQACLSKESIASDGDRVYYASPDGLVEISVNGISVVTEDILDPKDWKGYTPSTMVGEFYEGRYYGFYDFDVSPVDPVITAEVSGTVTDADEADIVNGTRTIILTLTNDQWVAEGVSFNNQRQDIIDGLTTTTAQTLGWNNLVRDGALGVGDVVRTSDTVVTITLPVVLGYAITSAEVIQPTIPNAALLLSSADVVTGSTFKIEPDAPSATVTMTGTLGGAVEADVVAGGNTIILTLTNDTWVSTLTDAMKQLIIDGLNSTTNEEDGWNDTVPQQIPTSAVVRTSDSVVTVTLPAVADYSITENETITAIVPYQALVLQEDIDAASSNSLGIVAAGTPSALFSGTAVDGGVTENEIIAGGDTIIITLTNDTWAAAGTGPIGSTQDTQALIDALIAQTSQTNGWNNTVVGEIDIADVVRTSATVCTITLDPVAAYSIANNETVGMAIPAETLVTSTLDLTVSNTFGITAQTPVTATLSGTVAPSVMENNIVSGGRTIILTLSDDTWVAAGATFDAQRQNIINGLDAATTPTNGWNNEIRDGSLAVGNVVRTSDTVVTITLPADAQYDITANETITATIPASALVISAIDIVTSPTFDITFDVPASAVVSGTLDESSSTAIIGGGRTIIITLSDDTWVAAGATFNAIRQDIINGLDAASSPDHGWNNEVRDGTLAVSNVVRTSDTVVTITLPATAAYDVNGDEVVTVTVPASALTESAIAVVATPTQDIRANSSFTSNIMLAYYDGADWDAEISFFDPGFYTSFAAPDPGTSWSPGRLVHSDTLNRWAWLFKASFTPHDLKIYTSDNDGTSWTERSWATTPTNSPGYIARSDDLGAFVVASEKSGNTLFAEYSTDGITWTDISTAVNNGLGFGFTDIYGVWAAGDYFFIMGFEIATNRTYMARSVDVSANIANLTSNWTVSSGFFQPSGFNTSDNNMFCAGNSRIMCLDATIPIYFPFSTGAYTIGTGSRPAFNSGTDQARFMAFGVDTWVASNVEGYILRCDESGVLDATDGDDWTALVGQKLGTSGDTVRGLFYDEGSDGANGYGFVGIVSSGSGVAEITKVYTSPDGETWTLQKTFAAQSSYFFGQQRYAGKNHLDGVDLE